MEEAKGVGGDLCGYLGQILSKGSVTDVWPGVRRVEVKRGKGVVRRWRLFRNGSRENLKPLFQFGVPPILRLEF
jgi:hypothetical protein